MWPMSTPIDPVKPRIVQLPHGWIAYLDDVKLASFSVSRDEAAEHVLASARILDSLIAQAKEPERG